MILPFNIHLNIRAALGIGIIVLISFLSVSLFSLQSMRLDEAKTLWASSQGIDRLLHYASIQQDAPLYSFILHGWIFLFGNTIQIARFLSFLFFLLSIACMYVLGRVSFDKNRYGFFAAALFAISPFMNWYANEARMYSLLALLAILNQYFLTKIIKLNSAKDWVYYTITMILGIYTHYFFLWLLVAHIIFFAIYRRHIFTLNQKKTLPTFLTSLLIISLTTIPWFLYARAWEFLASSSTNPIASSQIFRLFSSFLFGFTNDHANIIIVSFWPMIVLLAFLALQKNKIPTPVTMLSVITIATTVAGVLILSLAFNTAFLGPYLILTLPSVCLFLSFFVFSYPVKFSLLFQTILLVLMFAFLITQAISANVPLSEDYQQAAAYLQENAGAADVIALSSPPSIFPFEYYYQGSTFIATIPPWDENRQNLSQSFSLKSLEAQASTLETTYQRLWLLLSHDQGYQEEIKNYFDTHFEKIYQKNFSPNLNLYVYKLQY